MVVLLGSLIAQPALAGGVGYVDFEFLFNNHPEYEMKNQELQEAADRLVAEFQAEASSLGEDANLDELRAQYESRLDAIREELELFLINSVRKAIAEVAAANEIDVVLLPGVIVYGGVNLTPLVLEALYQSYGISVPSHLRTGI